MRECSWKTACYWHNWSHLGPINHLWPFFFYSAPFHLGVVKHQPRVTRCPFAYKRTLPTGPIILERGVSEIKANANIFDFVTSQMNFKLNNFANRLKTSAVSCLWCEMCHTFKIFAKWNDISNVIWTAMQDGKGLLIYHGESRKKVR